MSPLVHLWAFPEMDKWTHPLYVGLADRTDVKRCHDRYEQGLANVENAAPPSDDPEGDDLGDEESQDEDLRWKGSA